MRSWAKLGEMTMRVELQAELLEERGYGDELKKLFETLEEAKAVIGAFIKRYNNGWLLQRHGYMTPSRAREKLSRKAA